MPTAAIDREAALAAEIDRLRGLLAQAGIDARAQSRALLDSQAETAQAQADTAQAQAATAEARAEHDAGRLARQALRNVLESATDYAIIATDLDGRVIEWNEGARRILGWVADEMMGRPIATIFTEEDRAAGIPGLEMAQALAEERGADERWHLRRDGSRFFASGEMQPLREEAGTAVGFLKVLRDRTEQRLYQERLEQAEQRYQLTLAASGNIGWYDWDVVADRLYANELFAEAFGLDPRRGPEGAPVAEYLAGIAAEDVAEVEAGLRRAMARPDGAFAAEYRVLGRNGSRRWVLSRGRFYFEDGRPVRLAGTAVDITERKGIERALAASEARLRVAQEASGIGTFERPIQGDGENGRVLVSAEFARIYGLAPDSLSDGWVEASRLEAMVVPGDEAALSTGADRVAGRPLAPAVIRIRRADTGEAIWISRHAAYTYDEAGRPLSVVGTVQDVTARRRAELLRTGVADLGLTLREMDDIAAMEATTSRVVGAALGLSRAAYGTVDPERGTVLIESDWTGPGVASLAGTYAFRDFGSYIDDLARGEPVIIPDVAADPRTRDRRQAWARLDVRALINLPVIEHGRLVAVLLLQDRHPRDWTEEKLVLIRQAADLTRAEVERRRAEQRQRLLNEELAHRVKNTLAMVGAVTAQTIRNSASLPEAGAAVQARIAALATAHDALMQNSWSAARIREVVDQALRPHGGPDRFDVDGPDLMLGPRPALAIALMLHELATNAVKYGSLSAASGRVALSWAADDNDSRQAIVTGGDEVPALRLVWQESGGPPVAPPSRRGFGSKLIERGLASDFGGAVTLLYRPEGVVCTLVAPLALVLASVRG